MLHCRSLRVFKKFTTSTKHELYSTKDKLTFPDVSYYEYAKCKSKYALDHPSQIVYDNKTGKIREKIWYKDEEYSKIDNLHRSGGPAYMLYDGDSVVKEEWYTNNKLHRSRGPAYIKYFSDGTVNIKKWYKRGDLIKTETYSNSN